MFDNIYFDFRDRVCELTEAEIEWFYSIVKKFQMLDEVKGINIFNRNHEELDGKERDALGLFYTDRPNDVNAECFITIDNYFIHECFEY